jgi:periplasmic divalent cation tolerance protein
MTRCVEIGTTVGSRAAADELARAVVEARLAACAQVTGPVASVYRWQGAVEHAEEWACRFKTTLAAQPALEAALLARHPYELPEIVMLPLEGSAAYLAWVERSVGPPPSGDERHE